MGASQVSDPHEQGEGERVSDRGRDRQAELQAERIGWRARSRSMNRASRSLDERLGKMNGGVAALDRRLWHQAGASRAWHLTWHLKWDDTQR